MICYSPDGMRMTIGGVEAYSGRFEIWKLNENLNTKGFIRNRLKETKGWDGEEEQHPQLLTLAEREKLEALHPDNIMDNLSDSAKERWGITDETPTPSKLNGNINPLVKKICNKVDNLYKKYEHDVGKLKLVHNKMKNAMNGAIKEIKNDKTFKSRKRKASNISSASSKGPERSTSKRNTLKRKRSTQSI